MPDPKFGGVALPGGGVGYAQLELLSPQPDGSDVDGFRDGRDAVIRVFDEDLVHIGFWYSGPEGEGFRPLEDVVNLAGRGSHRYIEGDEPDPGGEWGLWP